MVSQDNQYAAFVTDFAAGALSEGEMLVARLHFALSERGARTQVVLGVAGGVMLEGIAPAPLKAIALDAQGDRQAVSAGANRLTELLNRYASADLKAERWRKSLFGVMSRPTEFPNASLLRLDPGGHAPRHGHDCSDVTVVLSGAFADDWGEYHRGDIAFAEAGDRHAPQAVGDETCICLVATPRGRPLVNLRGFFSRRGNRKGQN